MIDKFRNKNFQKKTWVLLNKIITIIEEYEQQNIKITLRQLDYQLVTRSIILNSKKEYNKVSDLLKDARYNGLIDWDSIVDNVRVPKIPSSWDNILGLVKSAISSYRLDRWKDQKYYVELFTEKDALSSILEPIADRWHIPFCVNRGYGSATALYNTAQRFLDNNDKECILLYLGDHDASGLNMIKDIQQRLDEFRCIVKVIPIALTMEQVKKYNLPPNPIKEKDSRSKWYKNKFGNVSWEVDALRPDVMIELVENSIKQYVDIEKMEQVKEMEQEDKKGLIEYAESLKEE